MSKFRKVPCSQPHRLVLYKSQRIIWFPHNTLPTVEDVLAKGNGPRLGIHDED